MLVSLKGLSDTDVKDIHRLPGFMDLATEFEPLAYEILVEGLKHSGLQSEQYLNDVLKARSSFRRDTTFLYASNATSPVSNGAPPIGTQGAEGTPQ